MTQQDIVFSGIQPTGTLHIGNYFGALKQWVDLQKDFSCFFCVVDLHALTIKQDPKTFGQKTLDAAMDLLALGVDSKKSTLFVQSQVPEHAELMWLLTTLTPFGELKRMTQWKDKSNFDFKEFKNTLITKRKYTRGHTVFKLDDNGSITVTEDKERVYNLSLGPVSDINQFEKEGIDYLIRDLSEKILINTNAGLLNYPVLMAADILLYKGTLVPVGEDQVQHVELARVLARKFNNAYGQTFPEPKPKLNRAARIMSLTEPAKKMSKSHGEKSYIALTDEPNVIKAKLAKAVTATTGGKKNPGVENLFAIMHEVSDEKTVARFKEQERSGTIKYAELKQQLADDLADHLAPFRARRAKLAKNPQEVLEVLENGRKKAAVIAQRTMKEVRSAVGLLGAS